jgi:hypothetical protein
MITFWVVPGRKPAGNALGVGLVVYIGQWILEPGAMRVEEGAHGAEALSDTPAPSTGGTPAGP